MDDNTISLQLCEQAVPLCTTIQSKCRLVIESCVSEKALVPAGLTDACKHTLLSTTKLLDVVNKAPMPTSKCAIHTLRQQLLKAVAHTKSLVLGLVGATKAAVDNLT